MYDHHDDNHKQEAAKTGQPNLWSKVLAALSKALILEGSLVNTQDEGAHPRPPESDPVGDDAAYLPAIYVVDLYNYYYF